MTPGPELGPELVIGLHWAGVLCYVGATILVAVGGSFAAPRATRLGDRLAWPGLLLHGAGLLAWWRLTGHGPYIDRFEVMSAYAWCLTAGLVVFGRIYRRVQAAGLVVYPLTFLMVAAALFFRPEIKQLPPTFRGIWLMLHIVFYNVSFAAIVIALAFSLFYLVHGPALARWLPALPDLPTIDLYAHRFAGFSFIFWAIGMLAGSIWAYQSWNIFWNWDPVQTWSLVSWALFGVYLHLRRFFGWSGARAAWLYVVCFLAVFVALFVTPVIESSIHAGYFK